MRRRATRLVVLFALAASLHAQQVRKLVSVATPSRIRQVSVCGVSGFAAGLARNGSVLVWRVSSGEKIAEWKAEGDASTLACAPDGKRLALGLTSGSVVITDTSGKPSNTIASGAVRTARRRPIDNLEFSPDGSLLAVSAAEGPVQLWDPEKAAKIAVLQTDFSGSTSMDFSPDSSLFATADADTSVRIYDRKGTLKAKYSDMLLEPFAVSFMSDGKQLVVAGADCTLRLIDTVNGRVTRQLAKQKEPVFAAAALPDGVSLLSLHIDAASLSKFAVLLWELPAGKPRELSIDGSHLVGYGMGAERKPILFVADSDSSLTAWAIQR